MMEFLSYLCCTSCEFMDISPILSKALSRDAVSASFSSVKRSRVDFNI